MEYTEHTEYKGHTESRSTDHMKQTQARNPLMVVMKETLASLFKPYRPILPITAHRNVRMRGQAFVTFSDRENANAARREVNEFPLYGKAMVGRWILLGSTCSSVISWITAYLPHLLHPSQSLSSVDPFPLSLTPLSLIPLSLPPFSHSPVPLTQVSLARFLSHPLPLAHFSLCAIHPASSSAFANSALTQAITASPP